MDDDLKKKIEKLSGKPGVYFFKNANEEVVYIGKAINIKKRVKSHFQKNKKYGWDFTKDIADVDFIETSGEREALILEQQFIKKLQPRWNIEWKDDKNYFYVAICGRSFPRVCLTHQPGSAEENYFYGPFVSGKEVKLFLKEIRKALPYRSCRNARASASSEYAQGLPKKPCFYRDLGLCLAPCEAPGKTRSASRKAGSDYSEMIGLLKVLLEIYQGKIDFFQGAAENSDKTQAAQAKNSKIRIEGYDVSNLTGTLATGSMVVFKNGKADKSEYRKFKIRTVKGQNDVASLREILKRRLNHKEWQLPDLILLDGGKGQLKAAKGIDIPVLALAKIGGSTGSPLKSFKKRIQSDGKVYSRFSKNHARLSRLPKNLADLFLQIRDEAHRFAIGYHKQRRKKQLLQ